MKRPKVVIADAIADNAIEALAESCEVDVAVGLPREALIERLSDAAAIVVRSGTQVDAALIDAAPALRVIGRAGAGLDNIDVDAATARDIAVINAPDATTISVAEHAMALILAQARRIPEADASLRAGRWERKSLKGVELYGKTLGIIGLGRIGAQVAHRAAAFGMRVIGYDPLIDETRAAEAGAELVDLDRLLSDSDFITLHAPRLPETEGLIDAAALAKMKPTARLINVARGGIVDEKALAAAIAAGTIAGAAIDVFSVEPVTNSPLFDLPQVVVSPHLAASTDEAQERAGLFVAHAIAELLAGS